MEVASEEYEQQYWPELRATVETLLLLQPGTYPPISFEQMYHAVYKCVCKQYSERLYQDLMQLVQTIIDQWIVCLNRLFLQDCVQFVLQFHQILDRFFHALNSIVPIFTYMNRLYLSIKLHTNLKTELISMFNRTSSDMVFRLLDFLTKNAEAQEPLVISPAVIQSTVRNLHSLDPNYVSTAPGLFSMHLAGIRAPMTEQELDSQRMADDLLQQQLRQSGFNTSEPGRKRLNSDLDWSEDSSGLHLT